MALAPELKKALKGTTSTGAAVQKAYADMDIQSAFVYEARKNVGIPEDPKMTLDTVISLAQTLKEEQEQLVDIIEPFQAYVWDGAVCFSKAMRRMFGHAHGKTVKTFFGENPPKMIRVEVSFGEFDDVPWGQFELPGFDKGEVIVTTSTEQDGRTVFQMVARVKRKHQELVKELTALTRRIIAEESIYKGKALELPLDNEGRNIDANGFPKFMDLRRVNKGELLFSADLERIVDANLFQMIDDPESVSRMGVPAKRCICLAGTYGTGKTMTAMVAAKLCEENDRTFFYIKDVRALADAIRHARPYGRVLVFAEDFDRVAAGERNAEMDAVVNILDGIDKSMDIIVVLTTNHARNINKVFRRSGRVDITIEIDTPDADAVERLIHLYGRDFLAEDDFSTVSKELADAKQPPSNVREVVEGAKLYALRRAHGDVKRAKVNAADLHAKFADKMGENRVYEGEEEAPKPALEAAMSELVQEQAHEAVEAFFGNGGMQKVFTPALIEKLAKAVAEKV